MFFECVRLGFYLALGARSCFLSYSTIKEKFFLCGFPARASLSRPIYVKTNFSNFSKLSQ